MEVLGIDIGGSGIKGAPVETDTRQAEPGKDHGGRVGDDY